MSTWEEEFFDEELNEYITKVFGEEFTSKDGQKEVLTLKQLEKDLILILNNAYNEDITDQLFINKDTLIEDLGIEYGKKGEQIDLGYQTDKGIIRAFEDDVDLGIEMYEDDKRNFVDILVTVELDNDIDLENYNIEEIKVKYMKTELF